MVRSASRLCAVFGVLTLASSEECEAGDEVKLMQLNQNLTRGDECRGFKECPPWPLPYKMGEYPKNYPWAPIPEFPEGFAWGLGTAAYQIEGAYNEDGRGASIWDTFTGANTVGMPGAVCKKAPCPVNSVIAVKGATGNVANNHYHMYKTDVTAMKSMGLKWYRFSIAWPRIVPTGTFADGVNQAGVDFYHSLLDELIAAGVTPIITMYHWDLPQGLMDFDFDSPQKPCNGGKEGWYECSMESGGKPQPTGLKSNIVKEFTNYAEFLLKEYGSKVKLWATFNEAYTFTYLASGYGKAPSAQPHMDMDIWPYVAGHNVILGHLSVVMKFREFQASGVLTPEHRIFITNNQDWREPLTDKKEDIAAAMYEVERQLAWFCDPIYGVDGVFDYPYSMRSTFPYMPSFTDEEKELLKQHRPDFFGLNHYGTGYAKFEDGKNVIVNGDLAQGKSSWLYRAAWGYRKLLNWIKNRYGSDLEIWGTESGWSDGFETALESKQDWGRLTYYYTYILEMYNAIHEDGVNMKGFMAWSLMDNFEWEMGYSERFGCLWVDLQFGEDPNAPTAASPIYNAYSGKLDGVCTECDAPNVKPGAANAQKQTRHIKNSILLLTSLWKNNALPSFEEFFAAATAPDICFGEGQTKTTTCSWDAMSSLNVAT